MMRGSSSFGSGGKRVQFKFRILDLIVLTTLVALLFGSFRQDLSFFRHLFCLALTALFSVFGVLLFSTPKKPAWLTGAIFGCFGGLVYLVVTYVFVGQVYEEQIPFHQFFVRDSLYLSWYKESWVIVPVSIVFGSAIGPLIQLRVQETKLPAPFARSFRISIGILSAMLLITVLRMFDRLVNFGAGRDLTPLLLIALVVFVIYTNQWLVRFYQTAEDGTVAVDPEISKPSPIK